MDDLVLHGMYFVKDDYFQRFPSPHWMFNKDEKRPYYYYIRDKDGIDWLIPMSSQIGTYSAKIEKVERIRGSGKCIYYHIGKVASIDRVFLIGDMFPVNSEFIKAPFTISGVHYIVKNNEINKAIYSKAMRYLQLVKSGVMKNRNDILGIKQELLKDQ